MGLFGGGYYKPGKGVDKNAPKKKGFFLYIDLVSRKLTKFIQAGTLFSIFSLPVIILIYFLSVYVFIQPISSIQMVVLENMKANGIPEAEYAAQLGTITFSICSMAAIFFVTMWGSGPLSAALSYIFRCFTREEHTWIWSDGKDKVKENLKQGFLLLLIDIFIFIFTPIAITFYYNLGHSDSSLNLLCTFITYVLIVSLLVYTMMHPYMYQIMITFNCSFKNMFKNALLLSIVKLPINFILTVLSLLIIVLPAAFFGAIGSLLLSVCALTFGYMLLRYPMEFYAARTINKLLENNKVMKEKNTPKIVYDEEE